MNGDDYTKAELIRQKLEKMSKTKVGLSARTFVQEATSPKSILHGELEWDNTKAGHQYRLTQAAAIIRSIKIRIESKTGDVVVRQFCIVHDKDGSGSVNKNNEGRYIRISDALNDEEAIAQILENAKCELRAFAVKYENLSKVKGFTKLFSNIKAITEE